MQISSLPPQIRALIPDSPFPDTPTRNLSLSSGNNKKARRRLFQSDETNEKEINQQNVKQILIELAEEQKQKWDFDFINQKPIGTSLDALKYHWEVSMAEVPRFYSTKNVPFSKNRCRKYNLFASYEFSTDLSEMEGQLSSSISSNENLRNLSSDLFNEEENIHPVFTQFEGNRLISPASISNLPKNINGCITPKKKIKQTFLSDFMPICKRSVFRSDNPKSTSKNQKIRNLFDRTENRILKKSRKHYVNTLLNC